MHFWSFRRYHNVTFRSLPIMDTSPFMNFELCSIMRERRYYSVTSLCEVLYGNPASVVEKIEKYLQEEQNCFYVGFDFDYFSKLAKSALIMESYRDDEERLWISNEVLLHIINAVKKGQKGRKKYLLTGKKASSLRNDILERIVDLNESSGRPLENVFWKLI